MSPIQLPTNNHLSDVVEGGRDDVEHGMYGCFQENDMEEGDCNIYSIRRKWGKNLPELCRGEGECDAPLSRRRTDGRSS